MWPFELLWQQFSYGIPFELFEAVALLRVVTLTPIGVLYKAIWRHCQIVNQHWNVRYKSLDRQVNPRSHNFHNFYTFQEPSWSVEKIFLKFPFPIRLIVNQPLVSTVRAANFEEYEHYSANFIQSEKESILRNRIWIRRFGCSVHSELLVLFEHVDLECHPCRRASTLQSNLLDHLLWKMTREDGLTPGSNSLFTRTQFDQTVELVGYHWSPIGRWVWNEKNPRRYEESVLVQIENVFAMVGRSEKQSAKSTHCTVTRAKAGVWYTSFVRSLWFEIVNLFNRNFVRCL